MSMNKELYSRLLNAREEQRTHVNYREEASYYSNVARGDIAAVKKTLTDPDNTGLYNYPGYGQLSEDILRNIRYHFVIAAAMITRSCAENGLERELAYTLSDLYIEKMDSLKSPRDILMLQNEMLIDFAEKMREITGKKKYSIQIIKAIEYIDAHLNENITAEKTAEYLKLNRSYLSVLFRRETGITLKKYICSEKVKAAADYLRFSDLSCSEISEYFCFASQSYFIKCFRDHFGCTPNEYRAALRSGMPAIFSDDG